MEAPRDNKGGVKPDGAAAAPSSSPSSPGDGSGRDAAPLAPSSSSPPDAPRRINVYDPPSDAQLALRREQLAEEAEVATRAYHARVQAPPLRGVAGPRPLVLDIVCTWPNCVVGAIAEGSRFKRCGGCLAPYCSHNCQVGDWRRHRDHEPRRRRGRVRRRAGPALPARALHRVAASVPLRAAALIEPAAVALNAVLLAGVGPGSLVAVLGDGPIGLLLLMVSRALGAAALFVVGADDARLALAARLGAESVVDARAGDMPGALRRLAAGRGLDVVLEASGSPDALHDAVAAAAPGAVIVLQGLCGAPAAGAPPRRALDADAVVVGELTLRGAFGSPGRWPAAIALVEAGRLDLERLVTHELPLRRFGEAFALVRGRGAVKVLLRPE